MSSAFIPLLTHSRSSTECVVQFHVPTSFHDERAILVALELVRDAFDTDVAWSGFDGRRATCIVSYQFFESFANALLDALAFACARGHEANGMKSVDEMKPPRPP